MSTKKTSRRGSEDAEEVIARPTLLRGVRGVCYDFFERTRPCLIDAPERFFLEGYWANLDDNRYRSQAVIGTIRPPDGNMAILASG